MRLTQTGRFGHSQIRRFSPFCFTPRGGWIPIGRQVRDYMPCHRLISRLRSFRFLFVKLGVLPFSIRSQGRILTRLGGRNMQGRRSAASLSRAIWGAACGRRLP
jgi:hypothetical protein